MIRNREQYETVMWKNEKKQSAFVYVDTSFGICNYILLFTNVRIHSYSRIHSTVVLPYCNIGNDVRLTNVVVDRGVNIPNGLVVGEDPELDKKRFRRTENGVCLITKDMIDKLDLT